MNVREMLRNEYMEKYGVSQYRLAKDTGLSETTVGRILDGKARITVNIGIRLAIYFGTDEKFWIDEQCREDIAAVKEKYTKVFETIVPLKVIKDVSFL